VSRPPSWFTDLAEAAARVRYPPPAVPASGSGRPAAVLMLFGESTDGRGRGRADVLLIERARTLRSHAGQPAFPGGTVDPGDDGPAGAALREAVEETGLDPGGVQVVTMLPPLYVPASEYVVTPVLAWWREPSVVSPVDVAEVTAVVRVPIEELVDPANRLYVRLPDDRRTVAFEVGGLLVWGMTAALLAGLLSEAGLDRPWDQERVEDLPADLLELAMRSSRKESR